MVSAVDGAANVLPAQANPIETPGAALFLTFVAEGNARRRHIFISYVPENSPEVDRLRLLLASAGATVWDDDLIDFGVDRHARIRKEITDNTLLFLACFSRASTQSAASSFNEQLGIAIEQLRMRRLDEGWLVPVKLDDCDIPDYDIGAGRMFSVLNVADLSGSSTDLDKLFLLVQRIYRQHYPELPADPAESDQAAKLLMLAKYRAGLDRFRQFPDLTAACDGIARLLDEAEKPGANSAARQQLNATIFDLDERALDLLGQSYRETSRIGFSYADWRTVRTPLARSLHYADFGSLTENHTRNFVGRAALMRQIYDTVNERSDESGYTVITGPPGFGKSAVMARLIQRERWAHHYVGGHLKDGRQILESICAQLIRIYGLRFEDALYDSDNPCGPLCQVLEMAAESQFSRPIVVVIDGFDESEDFWLGALRLPRSLPTGTFIVVTRKPPGRDGQILADRMQRILMINNDDNQRDLCEYIAKFIAEADSESHDRIRAFGLSDQEFGEQLARRSEGNFMYVTAILPDIGNGKLTPATLDSGQLPGNLDEYYGIHWKRLTALVGDEKFRRQFMPVIQVLASPAARRGPVTVSWLAARSALQKYEVREVLNTWSPFFLQDHDLIRFCHSTFRDFLTNMVA